jgi:hypothetical protein
MPAFIPQIERTDEHVIERTPEGDIVVSPLDAEETDGLMVVIHEETEPEDWNANLAESLSPSERMVIASELEERLKLDETNREEHFRRMENGMELIGLKDMPTAEAPFKGASTITHPMVAQAMVNYQSRAIDEVFPSAGPVKTLVIGQKTREREEQAERVQEYLNYKLTVEDPKFFWHIDNLLFYLPLAGSAFLKCHIEDNTGQIVARFVTAEDLVLPYTAQSLEDASRVFHLFEMGKNDVKRAQAAGRYLEDAKLLPYVQPLGIQHTETGDSRGLKDMADSREPVVHEEDVTYRFAEAHIDMAMPWDEETDPDGVAPPYIITFERESLEVVSVRRNWRYQDPLKQRRQWIVHFKFLPGFGVYGLGMLHILAGLANAVSGGIRAMLDSAAFANMQGGFRSKDAHVAGEFRLSPGEWADIDLPPEDLKNAFFPIPAKEPSPALAAAISTLIDSAKEFMNITEVATGSADNRGPVGTTLALIEQATKPQSAIHKRLHVSLRSAFQMLSSLTYEFMETSSYPYELPGASREVLKSDFDGRVDVLPVSDPNIWSATQRIAQNQAVLELITADPQLYDEESRREAHRRMMEALRIPNPDEVLPDKRYKRLDPVSENQNIMLGKAVRAFPEQDHMSHIAIHQNFAAQQAAENPDLVAHLEPVMMAHIMEHKAMVYRTQVEQSLGIPLPPHDLFGRETEEIPPELEIMISQAVAARLQPPPEPPPEQQGNPDEDSKDAETIAKIQRMEAETMAKLAQKNQEFQAEEKRKQLAFEAEQKRQNQAARQQAMSERRKTISEARKSRDKEKAKPKSNGKEKPGG